MRTAIIATLLVTACASAPPAGTAAPEVIVHLTQVTGSQDMFFFAGPVNVTYQISIENPRHDPVTMTRLELRTVGGGGAYVLYGPAQPMHVEVRPGMTATVELSVPAVARGGNANAGEPVTIRGTAYFEAPSGQFTRLFNESIRQAGR